MEITKTEIGYRITLHDEEILNIVADRGLLIDGAMRTYSSVLLTKEDDTMEPLRDSCKNCLIRIEEHRCSGVPPKHKCLNNGSLRRFC